MAQYLVSLEIIIKTINMKKYVLIALTILLFSFIQGDFVSTKISSHVSMDLAKELVLVPLNDVDLKYSKQNAPMAVYETTDQDIKLVVRLIKEAEDTTSKKMFKNPEASKAQTKDIVLEKMFKKSSIASKFDAVTFTKDTIQEINGNEFIVFEYNAEASGVDAKEVEIKTETYVYYQICYIKNKTYIFNFYCPKDRQAEWQSKAILMMNSVKIRK